VSVSADGNTIAEASNDGYVRVFGRNSNTTLWSYSTAYIMYGVAVSRDGKTISAGGMDGYLKVFNRLGNTPLLNFDTGNGISNVVAISSDGSTIACGNANGANSRVYLFSKFSGLQWDYAVPDDISTLFGPGVGISGDGTLVAYGCSDYKLYVFQYDYDAPVIGTPAVAPPSPVGGQSASISVSVTDNLEVFGVTLHYWNSVTSSWSSVPMSPAGAAYEATIGPFSSGDVVSYYVSATDTSGNTASSPASAPLSYYTFTVGVSSEGALVSQNMISVLIGVALGAVIVIVASFAMMRGKKSRR
jgi:WD40 repeat protein